MDNTNSDFFNEIDLKLKKKQVIKKSDLCEFSSIIANAIVNKNDLDESYYKLSRYIESLFAYSDEVESKSFYAGAIYGIIKLHQVLITEYSLKDQCSDDDVLSVDDAKAILDYLSKTTI